MGFFGKIKNFFFETEAQILIKSELETQRKANEKLFEWNEKLQSHNNELHEKLDKVIEHLDGAGGVNALMVAFFKDTFEKFDGLDNTNHALHEKLVRHIKPLSESVGKNDRDIKDRLSTVCRDLQDKLEQVLISIEEQFKSTTQNINGAQKILITHIDAVEELVKAHDEAVRAKLEMFYADMNKRFDKTDELVCALADIKINPLIETAEAIRSGVGDTNDRLAQLPSLLDGHFDRAKTDLNHIMSTLGNVEEVVTNPKPHSDLMAMTESIQKSVEHINGFLNSEEYKQQWDMTQVERQMVEVRQLLETVEALLPTPSGRTQTKILELLASTDLVYITPKMIMDDLDFTKKQVYSALARMCKNGSLVLLGRGQYALPNVGEKLAGDSDDKELLESPIRCG